MYRFLFIAACFWLASFGAFAQTIVLEGATLYDGNGGAPLADSVVVIEKGTIRCVGADCKRPSEAKVVDVSGKYLTPGLVDAHVHYAASGWFDTRFVFPFLSDIYSIDEAQTYLQSNTEKFDRSYLCSGVTAVFDTGSFPWTVSLQEGSVANPDKPRFVAAGQLLTHGETPASGAVLNGQIWDGIHEFLPMSTDEEALSSVAAVAATGASALKVWFDPLPQDLTAEYYPRLKVIGDAAHRHGMQFIVHTWTLADAKAAVRAGADVLVHSVYDKLVDDEFIQLVKENDVVYEPTSSFAYTSALSSLNLLMGDEPQFDDPNYCIDPRTKELVREGYQKLHPFFSQPGAKKKYISAVLANGEEQYIVKHNMRALHQAGATIATSTDAGNPNMFHGASMLIEMKNMQAAGLPAEDILVMSTKNGAKALGLEATLGTLEVGKNADLVVLDEDPGKDVAAFESITHVMRFGQLHAIDDLSYGADDNR